MKISEATDIARELLRVQPNSEGVIIEFHNVGGVSYVIETLSRSRKSIQQELAQQLTDRMVKYFEGH